MANYFNILAGLMTFLAASAIDYALWNPVMDWLEYFPTGLFVLVGAAWVMMLFVATVYMPFIMLVSDDTGK